MWAEGGGVLVKRGDDAALDALEVLRRDVLQDGLEMARRRRQLADIAASVAALDAEVLEVSALLLAGAIERLA